MVCSGEQSDPEEDAKISSAGQAKTEHVFCCKFPGCVRTYVSSDGVRKHCRKHHPQWLAELDELAKEGRTTHRSELYCTKQKKRPADEVAIDSPELSRMQKSHKVLQPAFAKGFALTSGSSSPTTTDTEELPHTPLLNSQPTGYCAFTEACLRGLDSVPFLELDPAIPGQLLPEEPANAFHLGNSPVLRHPPPRSGFGGQQMAEPVLDGSRLLLDFLDII